MTRDQIALALQQQQQRGGPGRPLGSPFAPAPVPQQAPMVAGTPTSPIAAPTPQYGFATGYNAALGAPVGRPGASPVGAVPKEGEGGDAWAKKLKEMLFGAAGTQGGAAP